MSAAAVEEESTRRVGGIPIRNLYVMLAFGNALRGELSAATCGALEDDQLPLDILARLLLAKLVWVRRRGTPRGYRVRDDVAAAPEGTIDLPTTIRGMHLLHRRVAFRVDELQLDTAQNRLLCAGIRALLRSPRVSSKLRDELRQHAMTFHGVSYISSHDALKVTWPDTTRVFPTYGEALALARLAVLASLPDEAAHEAYWRQLLDDHQRMGELFERFVRGFLVMEFAGYGRVCKPKFRWSAPVGGTLLPEMRTDLVIEYGDNERIAVGECKLYQSPLTGADRSGKPRLRRDHLFQLFAYLAAASERYPGRAVEGLLIYGRVAERFDTQIQLRRYPVRLRTLGLHQPWPVLRRELVGLWG